MCFRGLPLLDDEGGDDAGVIAGNGFLARASAGL